MSTLPTIEDLTIWRGQTYRHNVRWFDATRYQYATVTNIEQSAPLRITTAQAHNLKPGWMVAMSGIRGMKSLNAENIPPKATDYVPVDPVVSDVTGKTLEINHIDGTSLPGYEGGGILRFHPAVSMAGCTAKLQIRETPDGPVILEISTSQGGIQIDDTNHVITFVFTDEQTNTFTFTTAVYALEVYGPTGDTDILLTGSITVVPDITR